MEDLYPNDHLGVIFNNYIQFFFNLRQPSSIMTVLNIENHISMKILIAFLLLFPIVAFSQDSFQKIFSGQFMASSNDSDLGVDGGYIFVKILL
jgi:hypothetical protein